MELSDALAWAATRKHCVLITIRSNGRPQSSDVVYAVMGDEIRISVTGDRAKTRNLARDPRAVIHITDPGSWSYLSLEGDVELTPITTAPDDATADDLVDVYRAVAGEHDDWAEVRQAMIDEGRQVIVFRPTKVTGQIH